MVSRNFAPAWPSRRPASDGSGTKHASECKAATAASSTEETYDSKGESETDAESMVNMLMVILLNCPTGPFPVVSEGFAPSRTAAQASPMSASFSLDTFPTLKPEYKTRAPAAHPRGHPQHSGKSLAI